MDACIEEDKQMKANHSGCQLKVPANKASRAVACNRDQQRPTIAMRNGRAIETQRGTTKIERNRG